MLGKIGITGLLDLSTHSMWAAGLVTIADYELYLVAYGTYAK
jgi:hypothetical protein